MRTVLTNTPDGTRFLGFFEGTGQVYPVLDPYITGVTGEIGRGGLTLLDNGRPNGLLRAGTQPNRDP